jgi:hypothetical protein
MNETNKLTVNTTYNVTMSTATCFGYINIHHQTIQKQSSNIQPQYLVSGLKSYNEFTCKMNIKNIV